MGSPEMWMIWSPIATILVWASKHHPRQYIIITRELCSRQNSKEILAPFKNIGGNHKGLPLHVHYLRVRKDFSV